MCELVGFALRCCRLSRVFDHLGLDHFIVTVIIELDLDIHAHSFDLTAFAAARVSHLLVVRAINALALIAIAC